MFSVGQIEYFLEVAKNLSFSKAADALNTDQTTISKSISKLEKDLGVKLFNRTTRKISLTEAGIILQREGSAWLEKRDTISNDVKKADPSNSISLSIISFNFFNRKIQDFLLDFCNLYPDIEMNYDRVPLSSLHELSRSVRKHQSDIGIVPSFLIKEEDLDKFIILPIAEDTMCIVVSELHPLANFSGSISQNDLNNYKIEMVHSELDSTEKVLTFDNIEEYKNVETMISYVRAGRGATIMPRGLAQDYERGCVLLDLINNDGSSTDFQYCFIVVKESLNPAIKLFLDFYRTHYEGISTQT